MTNIPTQLREFWSLVTQVWSDGVWGIDIGKILTALAVFVLFLILRRLLSRFLLRRLRTWASRTATTLDDAAVAAMEPPIGFIPIVLGAFFALEVLALDGTFATIATRLVRSLIAFNIFWAFYRLIGPLSAVITRLERILTSAMLEWLVKAVKVLVAFLGAATILEVWGIEVAPLLAGLGLFGVAVALGAQDLFKNLIAGLLIIAEKRFNRGDWILVDGIVEGTVESIGFRSTVVRRFDKAPVYVPNAKLSDSAVTNFAKMTHRRIYWKIGVEYRSSIEQLREIRDGIEAYILGSDAFAHPPEVPTFVRIDAFGPSSIDIMMYCFTKTTNWGEWLAIKEDLAYAIKDIVEGADSGFAFPSQSVYVERFAGEQPEVFVPPTPNKDTKS